MKPNYVPLPPTGYNAQWKLKKNWKKNVPICTKKRLPALCALKRLKEDFYETVIFQPRHKQKRHLSLSYLLLSCVCQSFCHSVRRSSVHPFICSSDCPLVRPTLHPSICPSVHLSICPSIHFPIRLSILLSIQLLLFPFIHWSFCPHFPLSIRPSSPVRF